MPASRPGPASKDRYSLARPLSLERFRSVFAAYDMNGDGKISRAEAKAGGMGDSRFLEYDLDRDGVVGADEFDLCYGSCLRRRGQAMEAPVQERLAALERLATQRGWRVPAPKESESPISSRPDPNETPASKPANDLGRRRYGGAQAPTGSQPNDQPIPRPNPRISAPSGSVAPRSGAGGGTASRPAGRR